MNIKNLIKINTVKNTDKLILPVFIQGPFGLSYLRPVCGSALVVFLGGFA